MIINVGQKNYGIWQVAWVLDEKWTPTNLIPSPVLSDNMTWSSIVIYETHAILKDPYFHLSLLL